ncbi:MAG: dienelactone hydrolase family protein [Myxococcales bacterium]|nr:dienelactone hydrolase family protein [Myxococcales bacterium]MCB9715717.1 dienelactone hydrolase family protein [Myxococcales bacterium]
MVPRSFRLACLAATLALGCSRPPATATPGEATPPPAPQPEPRSDAPEELPPGAAILDEEGFAALHQLSAEQAPLRGEDLQVAGVHMYLSLPEGATAPLPAVVVIHEWWGLDDHIRRWADRLAADGYAALAVDLYDGAVATDREAALSLMQGVDETRAGEILAAAHRFLAEDSRVRASRRGVVGWSFGGDWSLRLALAQPDLDAAVIYYGRLETDPTVLASIHAPIMGVFGNEDAGIPPATVDAFAAAMKEAGKSLELHRYDAQHAFADPSSGRYNPEAAEDAWSHTRAFLAQQLERE